MKIMFRNFPPPQMGMKMKSFIIHKIMKQKKFVSLFYETKIKQIELKQI